MPRRCYPFIRIAKRLYEGETLTKEAQAKALHYGIFETINEMELWKWFGSRSEMLAAPHDLVERVRWALLAKAQAEKESADEMKRESGGASSSSGTGGRVREERTTSSSYRG